MTTPTDSSQFVVFHLNETVAMALNVHKVKEVLDFESLSLLPGIYDKIKGIFHLRGAPIPVLDLAPLLRVQLPEKMTRLLICEIQGTAVAVPVFKTDRIYRCAPSDFLPPPLTTTEPPLFISGLIRRGQEFVSILDVDSILSTLAIVPAAPAETEARAPKFTGRKILLVEDSHVMQKRLVSLFKQLGLTVTTADNGVEGLKQLERAKGEFDLVFTDIEMPLCDGITMAREIKRQPQYSHLPIVFNSALSNPALTRDIEAENLGQYLVKYDESLIIKHLTDHLEPATAAAA